MRLIAPVALAATTLAGTWGTSVLEEQAHECSARITDIDQERHRMDLTLRRVQDSLATLGIIASDRDTMTAKYLVAASCWEDM